MLRPNLDIQDYLINVQIGNIRHIGFPQNNGRKVYVKFSHE